MNNVKDLLHKDSLGETEKMLGNKHWSKFNAKEEMLALSRHFVDSEIKRDALKEINDTHFGLTWSEFKKLIRLNGFVEGYSYDIKHDKEIDEAIIYYHPKGLVIWATSYFNKSSVNGGTCYGEIKTGKDISSTDFYKWRSTGGMVSETKDHYVFTTSFDVREGLFTRISELEKCGEFLKKWTDKKRFLWFLDYTEDNTDDYKKITDLKIKKCHPLVKEIIGAR
jgi:hypothetical protein